MFVDSHGNPVVVGDVYLGKDNRWYEIVGFKPESRNWPVRAMPEGFDPDEADGFAPGFFWFECAEGAVSSS